MSISVANLGRSPAVVKLGGQTLFMRDDQIAKHAPIWNPEGCTLHGQIDKSKKDLVIKHNVLLFGLWQSISVLFPSYILNPVVGISIFGTGNQALVIQARNNDRITYGNSQITKLANLYLGVDAELFAAAVEITSILKSGSNPEDAGAYFVRDTNAYTETTFAMTNFKKVRFGLVWGAISGFGAVASQKGFNVSWNFDAKPDVVDGYGTVDFYAGRGGLVGAVKYVPIGPTQAQVDTAQAVHSPHGTLLSANSADATISGSGVSVVLKNAGMVESSTAFGIDPLRVNEQMLETTRGVSAGVASAVATVS